MPTMSAHAHTPGTMEDGEFWVYRVHEFNRVLLDLEDGADEDSMLMLVRYLRALDGGNDCIICKKTSDVVSQSLFY